RAQIPLRRSVRPLMRYRAPQLFVNCLLVSAILFSMPARSALPFSSHRGTQSVSLVQNAQVQSALAWFKSHVGWINDEQARLTEIPAPPFAESQRADAVKVLLAALGLEVHIDKAGNVIGELRGANDRELVLVAAHMDTVFPAGTNVKVRREKDRM